MGIDQDDLDEWAKYLEQAHGYWELLQPEIKNENVREARNVLGQVVADGRLDFNDALSVISWAAVPLARKFRRWLGKRAEAKMAKALMVLVRTMVEHWDDDIPGAAKAAIAQRTAEQEVKYFRKLPINEQATAIVEARQIAEDLTGKRLAIEYEEADEDVDPRVTFAVAQQLEQLAGQLRAIG